ncbi:hypothetical protein [Pseudomonas prosekii]|uniref:hypothetical protein n=1 Tax=Pseudomonas prosekii TaxID=1148509 RepID=UPI0011C3DE96|nr:hypothetical protein [Pseudomonas prosekii]
MTRIPALPPSPALFSSTAGAGRNTRALANGADFQAQLKAQARPAVVPPAPASTQVLLGANADEPRRLDVEAMLQMLACRKITPNLPNKIGRTTFAGVCPELVEDQRWWGEESCGGDFSAGASCEGGLNAAAIAVALSGSIVIWLPFEIARAPLQSPRIQIWRRRKPPSTEGLAPQPPDADANNSHG